MVKTQKLIFPFCWFFPAVVEVPIRQPEKSYIDEISNTRIIPWRTVDISVCRTGINGNSRERYLLEVCIIFFQLPLLHKLQSIMMLNHT